MSKGLKGRKPTLEPVEVWGEREGLKQDIMCHLENSSDPMRYILVSIREWAKDKGVDIYEP